MSSLVSLALYINGAPSVLECREPYHFKQVLDLNEQALSLSSRKQVTLSDDAATTAFIENLHSKKNPATCFLLLLGHGLNPFIVDDLYL